jgi:hypothetical protein
VLGFVFGVSGFEKRPVGHVVANLLGGELDLAHKARVHRRPGLLLFEVEEV